MVPTDHVHVRDPIQQVFPAPSHIAKALVETLEVGLRGHHGPHVSVLSSQHLHGLPHQSFTDALATLRALHHHASHVRKVLGIRWKDAGIGHQGTIRPMACYVKGVKVKAVQLGIGAILLHDENVHAKTEDIVQRSGIKLGKRARPPYQCILSFTHPRAPLHLPGRTGDSLPLPSLPPLAAGGHSCEPAPCGHR